VPERATLHLAGRVLPGEGREDWLAQLKAVVGPLGEHTVSAFDAGIETSTETPLFARLVEIAERHNNGARALPGVQLGGGDVRHPIAAGAVAYGFFPLVHEPDVPSVWELAHGRDERISVANLLRCVRYAWDLICAENDLPLDPVAAG